MLEAVQSLPDFSAERLMPSAPALVKFALGATVPALVANAQALIARYQPALQALGLADGEGNLDIDKVDAALKDGFKAQSSFTAMGFTFTQADADALVAIMKRRIGDA